MVPLTFFVKALRVAEVKGRRFHEEAPLRFSVQR